MKHPGMKHLHATGPHSFTALAVAFELSLGILALLLGTLTGESPLGTLTLSAGVGPATALLLGTALALPLFAGLVLVERIPVGFLRQLQRTVRQQVVPLFRGLGAGSLLLISLSAGIGEELLFRGCLQAALTGSHASPWRTWLAILCASLLFGVCHWLCLAYAVLATCMGALLGILFATTGSLWAPIAAHAVYDFLALLYLVRGSTPAIAAEPPRAAQPDERSEA